ncbi:hypothetical protein B0O99DRAFT_501735 [Bisporella sp. PMI_857]|nr:hypothetical protein B0O99DRAFT_501735 [Bisporella sp. PMI_857]
MQLSNILISFLLAAAVSAKGNRNGTTSIKSECKSIAKLTKITNLAANETKLALKFEGNQTAIDAFMAKAAEATTELTTLSANATLTESCAVIQAHEDSVDACDSISKMENLISKAANTTRLESKTNGNATKIAEIQAKASAAATKLAELQSNTTLTTFCAAQADLDTCSSITKLQKQIAKAASSTIEAREKGEHL